jgi:hypothetical protein
VPHHNLGSALKALIALAVVAAALHNPLQAAICVRGLVGIVLIEARIHARPSGLLARILR